MPATRENHGDYQKELPAGEVACPKCKQFVAMFAKVLGRRQFGTPIIDQKRSGVCLLDDLEIEDLLDSSESSSIEIGPTQ